MRLRPTFLLLAAGLTLASCYKDELDPSTLTNNPFDADYTGAPVFSLSDSYVEAYVPPSGGTALRFRVIVQVHPELFLRDTPYQVRYRQRPSGAWTTIVNNFPNDRFTITVEPMVAGQEYCWDIELGNSGSWGTGNGLCAIAE